MGLPDRETAHETAKPRTRGEELIERFESAWRRGERPAIDAFLPADPAERRAVLVELVHAELECRLKAGEPARAEEYVRRYPELAVDRAQVLSLVARERAQRRRCEPDLTIQEYLGRFPEYQRELLASSELESADPLPTSAETPWTTGNSLNNSATPEVRGDGQTGPEESRPAGTRYAPLRLHARGGRDCRGAGSRARPHRARPVRPGRRLGPCRSGGAHRCPAAGRRTRPACRSLRRPGDGSADESAADGVLPAGGMPATPQGRPGPRFPALPGGFPEAAVCATTHPGHE